MLLTHFHGDHLGQAETLRRASPELEVWCHEDEADMCEGFSLARDENIEGTDRLFRDFGVPERAPRPPAPDARGLPHGGSALRGHAHRPPAPRGRERPVQGLRARR